MNQRSIMQVISGQRRGAGAALLRGALAAASLPYAGAMRLRRGFYRAGILPSKPAAVPVISVGNLTAGGTGKTPMVAWIVQQMQAAGARPAILMRGYKAAAGASDEAELLKRLAGCPVIVDADRVAGARRATDGGADLLVMDDGFQHMRLRRDLDVVLIDATNPFGYGHCLPRGLLREPPAALRAADAVVITRSDAVEPAALDELAERLLALAPQASLHRSVHRPVKLIDAGGKDAPLDALAGRRALAFCGIGNPEAFFRTLGELGIAPTGHVELPDHEPYGPATLATLRQAARECQAEAMVTTQKDHIKLASADLGMGVWQLVVEMDIVAGRQELLSKLQRESEPDQRPGRADRE